MALTDSHSAPDLLMVFRGQDHGAHPGVVDGCERLVHDGTLRGTTAYPIDPSGDAQDHEAHWRRILESVKTRGTELVVLHHFHSPWLPDPRPDIERLRALAHRPLVALTNGDPFFNGFFRPSFPRMFLQAAESADVVLSTSMGVSADHIARRTSARISLLPLGACQVRFGQPSMSSPGRPQFRVVFIGSNNRSSHPLRSYHWYARRRERLVHKLSARFGNDFALFGRGWDGIEGWQGPVWFGQQQEACRRAEVVVGGVPFSPATYYMSNRPFIHIASGVPFVDIAVTGVDKILRDGEHWHLANSLDELVDLCADLLAQPAAERAERGAAAAHYVLTHHTQESRMRSLVATLTSLRQARLDGSIPPPPDLRFFLPEVDREAELELATRRWDAPLS